MSRCKGRHHRLLLIKFNSDEYRINAGGRHVTAIRIGKRPQRARPKPPPVQEKPVREDATPSARNDPESDESGSLDTSFLSHDFWREGGSGDTDWTDFTVD
jgi:hypothetical protein